MHRLASPLRALFSEQVSLHAIDYDEQRPLPDVVLPPALASSVPKRRAEFAAGRSCARVALAMAGCTSDEEIAIGAMRAPVWPEGFVGSISHAAGVAAAVVTRMSHAASLGLDIEKIVAPQLATSLRPNIARDDEMERMARVTDDHATAFTTVFAAKEALFKCVAPLVGRYFDFLDAEVIAATADTTTLRLGIDLGNGFGVGTVVAIRFAVVTPFVLAGGVIAPRAKAVSGRRTPGP